MKNAIRIGALLLVLISAANAARADEVPRVLPAQVQNDSLLRRAYRTRNRHIMDFIGERERKNGREGLRDPDFRAELKGKLDLLASKEVDSPDTEARFCASCERSRAQFNESEIRSLRALLAASTQNQSFNLMQSQMQANPFQMQMNQQPFGFQKQLGFDGNFFNTAGSMNQGITGLFPQILRSLMVGNQNYGYGYGNQYLNFEGQYYGNRYFGSPNHGSQWRFSQAPTIAGPGTSGVYNYAGPYSNITSSHYSLINRSSAPAVLPMR